MKMLCYVFLFTFLLNAVTIRGTTIPPGPEILMTQVTSESTPTSAQCQRPVLPENVILSGQSYQQTFVKGFIAKLECAVGYIPARASKKTIQCLGERWTDTEFNCKKKTCGALQDIPNGRYLYKEGIEYGAKVTAECDTGYQLYGTDTRICEHYGWSGRDLECEVVKCTELPTIENGEPEDPYYQYEYGQSVTYKCKQGFDMIGSSSITCSEDGHFQPLPPECSKISCNEPDIPHATRMEGRKPYKYKSFVRYKCDRGYKMNGSDYLVCEKDGWDPSPPQCTVVTCPKPSTIENGQFTSPVKERYEYEETVTYSCRKGFRLQGASTVSCSEQETFQPAPPQCVVVTCPTPNPIDNGQINGGLLERYEYKQTVTYSCREGNKLKGPATISCSEFGRFQPSPPECVMMCPTPPAVNNGRINGPILKWYEYEQTVTYSCLEGFRLHGASTLSCSEDGTFYPAPPKCAVTCSRPPAIDNGKFVPLLEQYEYGQAVTYSCTAGFRLLGASTLSCSEDGSFHPTLPKCEFHWIAVCILAGILVILVIGGCMYVRNNKNSGKVAVRTEEDGL